MFTALSNITSRVAAYTIIRTSLLVDRLTFSVFSSLYYCYYLRRKRRLRFQVCLFVYLFLVRRKYLDDGGPIFFHIFVQWKKRFIFWRQFFFYIAVFITVVKIPAYRNVT